MLDRCKHGWVIKYDQCQDCKELNSLLAQIKAYELSFSMIARKIGTSDTKIDGTWEHVYVKINDLVASTSVDTLSTK